MSNAEMAANLRRQAELLEEADRARLTSSLPQAAIPPLTPPAPATDIQKLIQAEVARQVASQKPAETPPPAPKMDMSSMVLGLLGQALSDPHQVLISKNLLALPNFVISEDGKAACSMFCESFEEFINKK